MRFLCVGAPEKGGPGPEAARSQVAASLAGGTRTLQGERDDGLLARDRSGRPLAYVWDGSPMANVELVHARHSLCCLRYGKGRHPGMFLSAMAEVR